MPFQPIIVINSYANSLPLTFWAQNLKFDLTKAFDFKGIPKSTTIRTFLRAGLAHGFVTVAPSLATGPVPGDPAPIKSFWPVLLQRLFEDWEVNCPQSLQELLSESVGSVTVGAAVIEGVNGQIRRDDGLSSCPSVPPELSVQNQVTCP